MSPRLSFRGMSLDFCRIGDFAVFEMQYHTDFSFCYQNESVVVKINPLTSKRNKPNVHIFFLYHQLKNLQIQDTHYTTYKILYDTTNTIPRGARYHVYPVALERRKKKGKGKTT